MANHGESLKEHATERLQLAGGGGVNLASEALTCEATARTFISITAAATLSLSIDIL
jgi:hypothetical protein